MVLYQKKENAVKGLLWPVFGIKKKKERGCALADYCRSTTRNTFNNR